MWLWIGYQDGVTMGMMVCVAAPTAGALVRTVHLLQWRLKAAEAARDSAGEQLHGSMQSVQAAEQQAQELQVQICL
jgi:hypothetical protein